MLYTAATISSTAVTTAAGATAIATYASFCLAGQEFVTRSLTTKLPLIIYLFTHMNYRMKHLEVHAHVHVYTCSSSEQPFCPI